MNNVPIPLIPASERAYSSDIPIPGTNYVQTPMNGLGAMPQQAAEQIARARSIRRARQDAKQTRKKNLREMYADRNRALYNENAAYWDSINPVWAAQGPERVLTSRGGQQADILGAAPGEVSQAAIAVVVLGWAGVAYFAYKAVKAPKGKKAPEIVKAGATWIGTGLAASAVAGY